MKREDRKTVASLIAKKSRRLTLEELAAKGRRHIRVITAAEAFQEIESVMDETTARRASEIAGRDRARILGEANERLESASQLRSESERLVEEQRELTRRDVERVEVLEKQMKEELRQVKSSLKALEENPSVPDRAFVRALFDELARREESRLSEWEARLETTMNRAIDAVRKTVMTALRGTVETTVDATELIVASALDEQKSALDSNVDNLEITESVVGKGVRKNLTRLKELRKDGADAPPADSSTTGSQPSGRPRRRKKARKKGRKKSSSSKEP